MATSNIKLLTKDERYAFNKAYTLTVKDSSVFVKFNGRNITTVHDIDEDFQIYYKTLNRKITIKKEAVVLWNERFKDSKYTLIDIQNAMNALTIGYQSLDYEDVKNQLEVIDKNDAKIF